MNTKHIQQSKIQRSTINTFQTIFPTLSFVNFNLNTGHFIQGLDNIVSSLPIPTQKSMEETLKIMRQFSDQQQYRYQKSLLQQQNQNIFNSMIDDDYQFSTMPIKKQSEFTEGDQFFRDDNWNWKVKQMEFLQKEEFFQCLN